jgi:hypothetical protein
MRRTSLGFFALLFVFACSPRPADHTTVAPAPGASFKQVVISLATKTNGTRFFTVVPDRVSISVQNGEQIDWIINNATDFVLTNIRITKFLGEKTGKTDPFGNGGTFSFPTVSAHSNSEQPSGAAKPDYDEYTYIVTGTIMVNGNPVQVTLDPRVIISQ